MYEIYANNTLIFSDVTPLESYKVINPKLTLEDSAAGSLEFTLPPGNVGYNSITCLTTECVVKKEGTEIWRGRVISETIDFWKNKRYMCEGELAYLVDTIQPPASYSASNTTIYSFLNSLLSKHNSQVNGATNPYVKTFTIGSVTVEDGDQQVDDDAINRFTNFETTLECINDKLVDRLGGHLRIRHVGNTRYLDYLADAYVGVCEQEIVFGSNLLDYVSDLSSVDWVSVVIPKGARLDREESSQPVAGLEEYLTGKYSNINDTWHSNASIYVKNPTAVNTYGYICATVEFSNIGDGIDLKATDAATKLQTSANNLVKKAKRYLEELQTNRFNKVSLTVSAVDLHYLNPSIESLDLMEKVRCTSEPHGMINVEFPVTKIELDLLNPSNTVYTLGTDYNRTLTDAANKSDTNLSNYISETYTPVESVVLNDAKKNAVQLIEGSAKGGFASWLYDLKEDPTDHNNNNSIIDQKAVDPDPSDQDPWPKNPIGIRIADNQTDKAANNRWLWTTGGLGHYTKYTQAEANAGKCRASDVGKWKPINIGITMDGRMVADMITTGCIKLTGVADRADGSWTPSTVRQTFLKVYNGNSVIGRWGSDGIWIGKGSLTLGTLSSVSSVYGNPKSYGFYEQYTENGTTKWRKTNDTAVVSGKTYGAYTAQIDNSGNAILRNAYFFGNIVGSNIRGSNIYGSGIYIGSLSSINISGIDNLNPNSCGFYEWNGSSWVKTNDTSVNGNKTYGAYTAQIDSNGKTVLRNAFVSGSIVASSGYIGDWEIRNGHLGNYKNNSQAGLQNDHIGCGRAGYGIVNIIGDVEHYSNNNPQQSPDDPDHVRSGGQEDWDDDKDYGFIQISQSGSPAECLYGIRIFGNGHVVWYDGRGNAYRDVYLSQIGE